MKTCGVYTITNIRTWTIYVGASHKVESRWQEHRSTLKHGKHRSRSLQEDWDRLGPESFLFAVSRQMPMDCGSEEMAEAEREVMARASEEGYRLYNRNGTAAPAQPPEPTPGPRTVGMVSLAELRRARSWTQADLADRIGVRTNTVTRWEMDGPNAARPALPTLRYLASVLGVAADEIEFGAVGEEKRPGRPRANDRG